MPIGGLTGFRAVDKGERRPMEMNGDRGPFGSVVVQVVCMGKSSHLHQSQPVIAPLPGLASLSLSLSLPLLRALSFFLLYPLAILGDTVRGSLAVVLSKPPCLCPRPTGRRFGPRGYYQHTNMPVGWSRGGEPHEQRDRACLPARLRGPSSRKRAAGPKPPWSLGLLSRAGLHRHLPDASRRMQWRRVATVQRLGP